MVKVVNAHKPQHAKSQQTQEVQFNLRFKKQQMSEPSRVSNSSCLFLILSFLFCDR